MVLLFILMMVENYRVLFFILLMICIKIFRVSFWKCLSYMNLGGMMIELCFKILIGLNDGLNLIR